MHIKHLAITIALLFISSQIIAQSDVQNLIKEGVKHHDNGDFEKAIETYKEALEIDPNSTLANYEIALSYFSNQDYEKSIQYSDIVLNQKSDYMMEAYMTKGSALDILGKTKESISLFEKAIKETGGHYLLYYNLALNYYKQNELEKAESNLLKAIENNPNHASSHFILANIHNYKGNAVQALLSTHYFLFLEPKSNRSAEAYKILQENFGGNVTRDPDNPNTINISLSQNEDSQFGTAELMISMLEASKTLEKNKDKTEDEIFIENTTSFFKVLGELKKKKNKDIWWTFYIPFFYDLAKSEHMEAYCMYIIQSQNENYKNWLSENKDKLVDFSNWLKNK